MNRQLSRPGTGKRRSREITMQKLRESGLEVFAKYGFDGASTKMVAEHAAVNEALISRYFGGKAGLLNAIILQFAREADTKAAAYPIGQTLEEELANFLTASIESVHRNPAFIKLVLSRALHSPMSRKTITRELRSAGEVRLLDRLKEYQEMKLIDRSVNLEEILEILRFFVAGTMFHRLAGSSSGVSTKRATAQMARAVAGILKSPG